MHELGIWEDDSGARAIAWRVPDDATFVETKLPDGREVMLLLLPAADAVKIATEMVMLAGEIRNTARLVDAVNGGASRVILPPPGFTV